MKHFLTYLTIFIFKIANGQNQNIDSISEYISIGFNILREEGDIKESQSNFTKAIELDSLCYDLYLMRGFVGFWSFGDSIRQLNSVNDLDKYISLRTITNTAGHGFKDTLLTHAILNYKNSRELGTLGIPDYYVLLLQGIEKYVSNSPRNKQRACELWKDSFKEGCQYVDILLYKYCN
jgi:hypothetical protein